MGTYNKGILGAFSGKIGPVVGASWRGKEIMRSLPRKTNRAATPLQQQQRDKFAMVTEFLQPINSIVSNYFGSNKGEKTRRNQAMSYMLKEAVSYVAPNMVWNFNKVLISRGDLLGFDGMLAATGAGHSIDFTWTDNSGQGNATATDKLVVVIYEESTKTTVYALDAGTRNQGTANVIVPAYLSALKVNVWATFVAADDKLYATSQYLDMVIIN